MYLRTPKRYTAKGRKRNLINLRWLWLYLLAPFILIPALVVWNYRDELGNDLANSIGRIELNPPTPTPTIAVPVYTQLLGNAFVSGRLNQAVALLKNYTVDVTPNDPSFHSLLAEMF